MVAEGRVLSAEPGKPHRDQARLHRGGSAEHPAAGKAWAATGKKKLARVSVRCLILASAVNPGVSKPSRCVCAA